MSYQPSIELPGFGSLELEEFEIVEELWHRAYEGEINYRGNEYCVVVYADASKPDQLKKYSELLTQFLEDQSEILKRAKWRFLRLLLSYRYFFSYSKYLREVTSLKPSLIKFGEGEGLEALYEVPDSMVTSFPFSDIGIYFRPDFKARNAYFDG